MRSSTDPAQNKITYSYSDSWSVSGCTPAGVNTLGFLTQITNALNFRTQASYYPCSGLMQSKRDENDIKANRAGTTFTHDNMNRLLTATYADGGQTSYNYHADALPFQVTKTALITSSLNLSHTTTYDGMAREKTASLDSDPAGADVVDTTYDNSGRVATVSNPHRSASLPTDGVTQTQYDALGRVTTVTKQDGSASTVSYSGNCTTTTDEAGKQRRSCSDALGRMIEVDEPGDPYAGTAPSGGLALASTQQSLTTGAHGATTASGSITIAGKVASFMDTSDPTQCVPNAQGFITCPIVYDSGSVTVTVGGFSVSASYGQGTMATDIATTISNGFNGPGSPVHAQPPSGATVSFTSLAAGSSANYAMSWNSTTSDPGNFANGSSFAQTTLSGPALTGGTDAFAGNTTYDYGTATLAIGSNSATANYGISADSNTTQLASDLASKLTAQNPPFNITALGANLSITWKTAAATGNISFTCSPATQSSSFSSPSFTCPASGSLAGGSDPEGVSLDHNYFVTQYSYDTLGNLLQVTQKGDPSVTQQSQWRVRTLPYNSLSQLLTATNPESGAIIYSYDADGNLLYKTSPAANQTGSGATTVSYCYDPLNRLLAKGYANSPNPAQQCNATAPYLLNPAVTYSYDAGTNGIGRMTSLTDQAGSGAYTYDLMGRTASESRTIARITKSMGYTYNLDGSLNTLTYPSRAVITYAPDSAGRDISAVDTGNGINYVTGATYGPDSSLAGFISGNSAGFQGITNSFSYNKRLQPVSMSAASPSQTIYSIGYDFHVGKDNGNVYALTNNRDHTRDQAFTYDALNRLTSAQNAGTDCTQRTVNGKSKFWGNGYTYDAWGNLTTKSNLPGATSPKCTPESMDRTADAQNRLHVKVGADYQYDAAGNMTYDAVGQYYSYDQENRISGAGGFTYTYDAEGNRVEKSTGGSAPTGTLYWYMSPGIVAESDLSGNLQSEYVFFGGERVARKDFPGNAVSYYFSDHLKTTDIVTDAQGNIKNESDFYPWGAELQFLNSDPNHYKFTGKERDAESGLDNFEARYFGSSMGRFMSPDPVGGHQEDPQTLNRYAYVRNNPLSLTDPTGLDFHLDCTPTEDNSSTCHGGIQGTTTTDENGKSTFTPTVISSKDGNLVDQNHNQYSATVDSSGVHFTENGSNTSSTGSWINGSAETKFTQTTGALSGFSFTFAQPGKGQTLQGLVSFSMSETKAAEALINAGFYSAWKDNAGNFVHGIPWGLHDHFRSPGDPSTGANSAHFILKAAIISGGILYPSDFAVPRTGEFHFGEQNPNGHFFEHIKRDLLKW